MARVHLGAETRILANSLTHQITDNTRSQPLTHRLITTLKWETPTARVDRTMMVPTILCIIDYDSITVFLPCNLYYSLIQQCERLHGPQATTWLLFQDDPTMWFLLQGNPTMRLLCQNDPTMWLLFWWSMKWEATWVGNRLHRIRRLLLWSSAISLFSSAAWRDNTHSNISI